MGRGAIAGGVDEFGEQGTMSQGVYSTDFHEEYAAHTSRIVRDRFIWLCALVAGFTLLRSLNRSWNDLVIPFFQFVRGIGVPDWHWGKPLELLPDALTVGIFGYIGWKAWVGKLITDDVQRLTRTMVQIAGGVSMLLYPVYTAGRDVPIESVFTIHVIACACMPWSLRDALRPMYPLLVLNAVLVVASLLARGSASTTGASVWTLKTLFNIAGLVLVSPIFIAPGAIIAWVKERWRTELFRTQFFESRYGQMRGELIDARRVHEALFPKPTTRGGMKLDYRYEPMRHIGGDFLFARWDESPGVDRPRLNVVLIDVTGHGVSSALTVNRLAGELERLYAEDPGAPPGQVLAALNRYVFLTMSQHALYCTAMCLRIEPPENGVWTASTEGEPAIGKVRYASGGHPPLYVRSTRPARDADTSAGEVLAGSVNGPRVRRVDSTSLMLGVMGPEDFDAGEVTIEIGAGDVVLAYTDGAVETRSASGELFGDERMARVIGQPGTGPAAGWSQGVLSAVDAYRSGPPSDDTVVVDVVIAS